MKQRPVSRPFSIAIVVLLATLPPAAPCADEGMWTFDGFPKQAFESKYGIDITDHWLEQVRLASVRLTRGCSGAFVSGEGLVMTNYHCVDDCVKEISTAERDYQKTGHIAGSRTEEIPCTGIEVNQLLEIRDVTAGLRKATDGLSDQEYNRVQKAEMSRLEKECSADGAFRCDVVTLYYGGFYHLYKYRTYRDARLVFVPEYDTAFFGGDPDNFQFPRFNFDLALLRVYADAGPAKTPWHFSWSDAGPREGEAVLVTGNPGGTDRLLTVSQLEYLRDVAYPRQLIRSSELRGILTQFSRLGPEQKRISQDEILSVENRIKADRGEYAALTDPAFLPARTRAEADLRAKIAADPLRRARYGSAWEEIEKAQIAKRALAARYSILESSRGISGTLFKHARRVVRGTAEITRPNGERLREYRDSALPSLLQSLFAGAPVYPELEELWLSFSLAKLREELGADDPVVRKVLGKRSPEDVARDLVAGTKLSDPDLRRRLWDGGVRAVEASDDPMIELARLIDADARAIRKRMEDEVEAPVKKNSERVALALFEEHGTSVYPDATFTPRITFGSVRGWQEDGRVIPPFTDFTGLFDRVTGSEPYVLPERWLRAKTRMNLGTPLNFVSDCDIIGGNSGSPVINRAGEIVGLIFDGNIHSLGGNFWFDEHMNRAVAVHSAGLLEALRAVYGAESIVRELLP